MCVCVCVCVCEREREREREGEREGGRWDPDLVWHLRWMELQNCLTLTQIRRSLIFKQDERCELIPVHSAITIGVDP